MLNKAHVQTTTNDSQREWVPLPEWAEPDQPIEEAGLWVGTMTARQQDRYDVLASKLRGDDDEEQSDSVDEDLEDGSVRALITVFTCQNDDGSLFFDEEDRHWLADKPAPALSRILGIAVRVNKMRRIDREAVQKNSAGQTSSLNTGSPAT